MAWITDSLRGAIEAVSSLNPFSRGRSAAPSVFDHQLAVSAYMASGMMRKVIAIPAEDRVREWRDWQADSDDIGRIEAEERRLGLVAKVKHAELLRGIGGGALVIVAPGGHEQPLTPNLVRERGIQAINVASRWQLAPRDYVDDFASPDYGCPAFYEMTGQRTGAVRLHPSRVIPFRGAPLPAGAAMDADTAFWGDSRLLRVWREVETADHAQRWFAELVRKAKLLRIGIPDLLDMMATPEGKKQLDDRVSLIAVGESSLNATVYRSGTGSDDPGEKIDDYQVNWSGIPAMMDAFDQRVAAVSDIPFTRLMGRSPSGMNATGQYDDQNWSKMIAAGQQLETRPCLEHLDPFLLRSAGVAKPEDVWWRWAPLNKPSATEETTRFKTFTEAAEKLANLAAMPERALNAGVQGVIEENGWMPAALPILAEMGEDERFGLNPDRDDTDPSALQARSGEEVVNGLEGGAGGEEAPPARRAANDAKPRPLYVQRKLLNADEFIRWAKAQGFDTTTPADELHVTVTYSRSPVDWMKMGETWTGKDGELVVEPGGARIVEPLGDKGAVVLLFASSQLSWRHEEMKREGASFDFPEYQPHVTITYAKPEGLDLAAVEPFRGALRFGPEIFQELDTDYQPGEA